VDNVPPPEIPIGRGFVDYLIRQVRYELTELGIPNPILWQDRSKIAPADDWNEEISNAVNNADLFIVILSRNYLASPWSNAELSTIEKRIKMFGAPAGQRRIFRVDKNSVPEDQIPGPLRGIHAVRFYSEEDDHVDEYFWGGKVRLTHQYEDAVRALALAISQRVDELSSAVKSGT
jgi:hypothetical protein